MSNSLSNALTTDIGCSTACRGFGLSVVMYSIGTLFALYHPDPERAVIVIAMLALIGDSELI